MTASVALTVRYGFYGEESKTVVLPLPDMLMRELMGTVELSDEPLSVLLASPAVFGGKGDAVTIRRKAFEMRRRTAEQIARAMVPELMKAFGVNDELDGYRVSEMSPEEIEYHKQRGRL